MISWCKTKLGDCCEIISGSTPSTNVESFWNGSICWATPKDLSQLDGAYISDTPRKLTQSGLDSCGATILPSNSVLFSSRAPIGHVAVNTVPMATNQGFKSFVPKDNRVYAKFLYHWLRKNRAYLESLGNGATFKEVSKTIVSRVEIPLPSFEEQRRIAEVLDRAEELRYKRREAIAQLDTLTQAIFIEMFGSIVNAAERFPSVQLSDVTKFIDYRGISPNKQSSGLRLVTARNIKRGWFENEPQEFIPVNEYDSWMRRGIPRTGDVLFTTEGHTLGSAAKLPHFDKVALAQRLIALQPKEGICSDYLLQVILTKTFQADILQRSTGSAARGISSKQLAQITLPLPPISLQQEFARRVEAVEKIKAAHRASLSELDALFASLQHRAFRGEL